MTKWHYLALAITAEVVGALSLRASVDHPGFYALVGLGWLVAFGSLSKMLRMNLSIGVIYAIWAASGVALTSVLSALIFDEPLTLVMVGGLVLIIGGVFMVEVGAKSGRHDADVQSSPRQVF